MTGILRRRLYSPVIRINPRASAVIAEVGDTAGCADLGNMITAIIIFGWLAITITSRFHGYLDRYRGSRQIAVGTGKPAPVPPVFSLCARQTDGRGPGYIGIRNSINRELPLVADSTFLCGVLQGKQKRVIGANSG